MKAKLTKQFFRKYYPDIVFHCPQIVSHPTGAIAQLTEIIESAKEDNWLLMGSSLGGYFSTYLSEKYHLPAVLINPAIQPYLLLNDYIGQQTNPYTQEIYHVEPDHMDQLKALERKKIVQNNYLVMVQTGDEVLDYRLAVEKFAHAELIVQQGGDHSFVNYEQMLPQIAQFFQLT